MANQSGRPARRTTPYGFVNFPDIPEALAENAARDEGAGRWPMMNSSRGQPPSFWRDTRNWSDGFERLQNNLASDAYRACGCDLADGSLFWIPPATWRRSIPGREGLSVVEAALLGWTIEVPYRDSLIVCHLMLSRQDLSLVFGTDYQPLSMPPPPPDVVLRQIRELDEPTIGGVATEIPEVAAAVLETPAEASPRQRGGRPPVHNWDEFWIEVALIANAVDGLPHDRSDLQRHMMTWCTENSEHPPDDSTVNRKLRALYDRRRLRN